MNTQLFTSALFLASLTAFAPSVRAQEAREPDVNARALAVQRVAERTRSGGELEILTGSRAHLPLTGRSPSVFKMVDRATGAIHGIALDDDGREVDMEALIRAEGDAHRARYGRIDRGLAERLTTANPGEKLRVVMWARELEPSKIVRLLPEEAAELLPDEDARSAYLKAVDRLRDEEVQRAIAPLIARCQAAGFDAQPIAISPVLSLELDAAQIGTAAEWAEVDRLYLDNEVEQHLASVRATVGAAYMETFRGITGQGIQVAQVEALGGRIEAANPFLQSVIQDATMACPFPGVHATAVAGVIRSRSTTVRGIAPNVSLLSTGTCTNSSLDAESRAAFAADFGCRVINLSFGSTNPPLYPGGSARWYDDLVINRFRSVVVSAGNNGATSNPRVVEPANAFNVIAVGNFDDRNDGMWWNDVIFGESAWEDPLSRFGDRQEPDVAAPGTNVEVTTMTAPWTGFVGSGTSISAPVVTGIAAMLIQRNGALGFWPESVRAIVMAAADHNIEGVARLSERDGAGGVNAVRADDVVSFVNGGWGGISYGCGTPSPMDATGMFLVAGRRTRVVIAYDTEPSFWNTDYATAPTADLDLTIISPSGSFVTSSASYDNTYEIVDFTPTVTGTHFLRISRYRCDMSPRYLGWAWTRDP